MKYEFRPFGKLQPILVKSTGKVYEVGEHPEYKNSRIIEVCDDEGNIHDAFEDELTPIEVEKQEVVYSEEEVYKILLKHQSAYRSTVRKTSPLNWSFDIKQWFEQFKKKQI